MVAAVVMMVVMEMRVMMVIMAEMVVTSEVHSNEDDGSDVKWKC